MAAGDDTYWLDKRRKYAQEPWAQQPSIFAQTVLTYLPAEGSLLELGAGLGADGIWFAQQGMQVTQTDLVADEMLPVPEGITIQRARLDLGQPLPYPPGSFDAVYAHLSLHYFDWERTEQLFEEIHNVLKSGGLLALQANSTSDPEYGQGRKLEEDYYEVDGARKRFFDTTSIAALTQLYKPLLLDDKGTSYKDQAKGVANLIRFIGKKG